MRSTSCRDGGCCLPLYCLYVENEVTDNVYKNVVWGTIPSCKYVSGMSWAENIVDNNTFDVLGLTFGRIFWDVTPFANFSWYCLLPSSNQKLKFHIEIVWVVYCSYWNLLKKKCIGTFEQLQNSRTRGMYIKQCFWNIAIFVFLKLIPFNTSLGACA